MTWDLEKAIAAEVIKPASELRVTKEQEEDYTDGFLIEKQPDVLTRGHVVSETRITKIEQRATFSKYILNPTKFNFASTVRILGYVMAFVTKCGKNRRTVGRLLSEGSLSFSVFSSMLNISEKKEGIKYVAVTVETLATSAKTTFAAYFTNIYWTEEEISLYLKVHASITADENQHLSDRFLNLALLYLYRKAASEVKKFNGKEYVKKIVVEKEGILYPKLVCNDNKGEQCSITMEEQNNMDILSQLIMSVNLQLE